MTVFYGVLDERTGRFAYANGVHNPPILIDRGGANPLETTGGVALGMFDGFDYADARVDMEPGARLVLFSDGVTEAFNDSDEAFGDDRLLETTRTLPGEQGPDQDVGDIVTAVDEFVGEAPRFDDITCVVPGYKGGNSRDPGAPEAPDEAIRIRIVETSKHVCSRIASDPDERPFGARPSRRGDRGAWRVPRLAGEMDPDRQPFARRADHEHRQLRLSGLRRA